MARIRLEPNVVDEVSFGAIVKIRDQLLEMQRQGSKVYRLESGDPSFSLDEHLVRGMEEALDRGKTHYTESTGIQELRAAIAAHLRAKNGIRDASAENVMVTNGGMNALYVTFRSLLRPGDRVALPDPMWTEIAEIVKLAGGIPVHVPVDGYLEGIRDVASREKLAVIFLNSPHNPTGKVFPAAETRAVIDFAREHDLYLVSDEAYQDVIFDGRPHFSPGSEYESTVSLFSTSKTYAMSGLRVGYLHARDPLLLERMKKMLRVTINGVNSVAQWGTLAALRGPQEWVARMRQEYQARRDLLYRALEHSPYLEPRFPEGAFYLWCRIRQYPEGVTDPWGMTEFILQRTGVGSVPGPVFGPSGANALRFAFSADTEKVREASELLRSLAPPAGLGAASSGAPSRPARAG